MRFSRAQSRAGYFVHRCSLNLLKVCVRARAHAYLSLLLFTSKNSLRVSITFFYALLRASLVRKSVKYTAGNRSSISRRNNRSRKKKREGGKSEKSEQGKKEEKKRGTEAKKEGKKKAKMHLYRARACTYKTHLRQRHVHNSGKNETDFYERRFYAFCRRFTLIWVRARTRWRALAD